MIKEKKRISVASGILIAIIVILVILLYFFEFGVVKKCESFECFSENLEKCSKTKIIYDSVDASWKYEIIGERKKECYVKVTLLQPKTANLEIVKLKGHSMECRIPVGVVAYPEKNLNRCNGRLKEELQTIALNKLHKYIIDNLEEIQKKLEDN